VIEARLESPLPASLPADRPTAVYLTGTACRPASLRFLIDGAAQRPAAFAMPRFDVPCRRSGFWGVVDVRPRAGQDAVIVEAELAEHDGARSRVRLGEIPIAAAPAPRPAPVAGELIAICLGTYEPDPAMLAAQIESIRAQSDPGWVCIVSDDHSSPERYAALEALVEGDARFRLHRLPQRAGFYRNFEHALTLAPPEASLVALCDQDDVWHPDKLAVLRGSLGIAQLVYSDMRLIDESGRVMRETIWRGRANNTTNLLSMLVANTVTGSASLMRREVVQRALPFPDSPGLEFHDHWLALVALASGELTYVDRPLYDYRQHAAAVVGMVAGEPAAGERGPAAAARGPGDRARRLRTIRPRAPRPHAPRMREWRAAYFLGYVPGEMRARTLLLRCGDALTADKRRGLERYLAAGRTLPGLLWFLARPLRALGGRSETLGAEWEIARGIVWRCLAGLVARLPGWPERLLLDTRFPDPPVFEHRRLRRWREQR